MVVNEKVLGITCKRSVNVNFGYLTLKPCTLAHTLTIFQASKIPTGIFMLCF